jgi:hypothetical protein
MQKSLLLIIFALVIFSGCSSAPSGTLVWIDVPLDHLTLTSLQTINIEGHASSLEGVARVEVSVNGVLVETISLPESTDSIVQFSSSFTPTEFGEYTIQVVAVDNAEEASSPDFALVIFATAAIPFTDTPTPVPPEDGPTPVPPEDGPTPVPPEEDPTPVPVVEYWAEPAEIEAGDCTTIYWEASNVQSVVFGGIERDFSGSYHDCMCETQTYPLTITHLDDSTEVFYVTILVSGTCATPTPVPDTTAPNPPLQLKPVDGVTLTCTSSVMLRWEAPSDPSGISAYRVQVERHSGDNNWQTVSGSPFTGLSATEMTLSVECGWTYRWRVKAIDGAGNASSWSGWFTFIDPLT